MMTILNFNPAALIILIIIAFFILKAIIKFIIKLATTILTGAIIMLLIYFVAFGTSTDDNDPVITPTSVKSTDGKTNLDSNKQVSQQLVNQKPDELDIDESKDKKSSAPKNSLNKEVFIKLQEKFYIRSNAINQKNQIKDYPVVIQKRIINNVTTYFVIIGPFTSEEEALDYLEEVKEGPFPFKGKVFKLSQNNYSNSKKQEYL